MGSPIEIEVRMEAMRHGIVQRILATHEDMSVQIAEVVDHAVAGFDFQSEVARLVDAELRAIVKKSTAQALQDIFWSQEAREAFQKALVAGLASLKDQVGSE